MNEQVLQDLNNLEYTKRYRVWEPFMKKYNCKFICEVGIRHGVNFEHMIKHKPVLAVAVDAWTNDGQMSRNDKGYSQEELDKQYEDFELEMRDKLFVRIHRDYSKNVAKLYPDECFDFIYIDADHSYDGVMSDLINWYPKVKKGGFLIGDDYMNHTTRTGVKWGVVEAVKDFTNNRGIDFFTFSPLKWGLIK